MVAQYRKLISGAGSGDGGDGSVSSSTGRSFHSSTAIDYVESLHQNNKVVLLYGKNNVLVLPVSRLNAISSRRHRPLVTMRMANGK
jgi:hypothetical protein